MSDHLFIKSTEVPLYRGKLVIIFTDSSEKLKKYVPDFYGKVYGHSWLVDFHGKEAFALILNFKNPNIKITPGVITHESIHIANFILNSRGVQPSFSNDEPITYLAEWVTDKVYEFMEKHNFKAEKN